MSAVPAAEGVASVTEGASMPTAAVPDAATSPAASPPGALLADRNFRWLFGGSAVSMVGDQFTLIALPWLVLQLTGDPLALGTALALVALPRALLILVGGAIVDRASPRRVAIATELGSAALLGTLAALDATGALRLWMADVLALGLGVVTAFGYPAASALLPRTVAPALLAGANAAMMTARQLSVLVGPALAGALIAALDGGRVGHGGGHGVALAIAVDAGSFLVAGLSLLKVRPLAIAAQAAGRSVVADIVEGLRAFWADVELRTLCLYFAAIGCFVAGPIQVALPVLASRQLPDGAASLGLLMAGQAAAMLAGTAIAAVRPRWRLGTLGATMLAADAVVSLALLPFGHVTATWQGVALLLPIGALGGYVQVALVTWIQRRVPPERLGRAMSVLMFLLLGLAPVAGALAGAALRHVGPATLFSACGLALLAIAGLGAALTPIARIRDGGDTAE